MRNRRRIADRHHSDACVCDRPDRRLTTATRSLHAHFALVHAGFVCLLRCFVSRLLRRERRPLARATKTTRAGRGLRDQIPFEIRDRDHRVIERCRDMHDAVGNVLLLFLTKDFFLSACFSHNLRSVCFALCALYKAQSTNYFLPGAFFFAIVARRGPLRVRAFVCVRWPRTGSERRCRKPR